MISFRQHLDEDLKPQKLKHVKHLEDLAIHNGHDGVEIAAQHLDDVHDFLLGKKSGSHVSEKFDGAPSVVFGKHPKDGKFFVGTKSAFNVNPKLNFTPQDVDANHGHSADLADKLKKALVHLPKIMPSEGGVYQGDLMYTKNDIQRKANKYHFTPNTITYSVPQDSKHGKSIKGSQLGIVVHTKYKDGKDVASMIAQPLDPAGRGKFSHHPDVHNIDPTINVNPEHYTHEDQLSFMNHKEAARMAYTKVKPEAMEPLEGHGPDLEAHVNSQVRKGSQPSVQGYINHLNDKNAREVSQVVMQSTKNKKIADNAEKVQSIIDNKPHFEKVLDMHTHLQKAKDVLVHVLHRNSEFEHTINGEPAASEGAVVVDKQGNMTKFVDRSGFSKANLNGSGAVAKAKAKK